VVAADVVIVVVVEVDVLFVEQPLRVVVRMAKAIISEVTSKKYLFM
jgi:hypothetical protein